MAQFMLKAALAATAAIAVVAVTAMPASAQRGPSGRTPTLTLYGAPGLQGDSRTFWQSNQNLQSVRFNDAAASLVAEGRWEVCADSDFRSICRVFEGRVDDLGGFRGLISSVRPIDGPYGAGGGGGRGPGGFGGGGYGGPGQDRELPYGGWGRHNGQAVSGRDVVFYPGRIPTPATRGQGLQASADQFCRAQGHNGVVYASPGRRGEIADVLCRR